MGLFSSGERPLSRAQLELLGRVVGRPYHEGAFASWTKVVGPVSESLARFLRESLIEDVSVAEKLGTKFNVAKLKVLLEGAGVRAKGKKADMVASVLGNLPPDQVQRLVADVRLFKPTADGKAKIDATAREAEAERSLMEAETLACLRREDAKGAGQRIARYEAQQTFPRGMGIDWTRGMPAEEVERADVLVRTAYEDLPIDPRLRREVGAMLAFSELAGEGSGRAAKRMLDALGGSLVCPSLEEFLRSPACGGWASRLGTDSMQGRANLYAHTRMFQASAAVSLRRIMKERVGTGIKIMHADEECRVCASGKDGFRWSELGDLPRLPRHWGCRCIYQAYNEAWEKPAKGK